MLRNATRETSEGTTAYQCREHAWMLSTLAEAAGLFASEALDDARARLAIFEAGLERHIRMEEEVLFPLFEVRTGLVGGPTALMREEHREMSGAVARMRSGLERADAPAFHEALRQFREFFVAHASKEEHFLYPTLDRMLSAQEAVAVTARLQRG